MRTEDFALIARQWPAIAGDEWPGTVIADLGRLQEDSSAGPVPRSTIVLLIARATPEGLYHLRERASVLAARLGQGIHGRSPLTVALICPAREHSARLRDVKVQLAAEATTSTSSGGRLDCRGRAQRAGAAGRAGDEEGSRRRPSGFRP